MDAHPIIRPAALADASALAVLIDIAGEGIPAYLWSAWKAPDQTILEFGRERARREEGGFSYRNAIVAEVAGEIAASLVGYRLDDPYYDLPDVDELPDVVHPLIKLEAQVPGTWYVNVLAAFPEFQGQGMGTKLLEAAETKGREGNAPAMSVIVASWNDGAARLYARAGYADVAREPAVLPPGFAHEGDWVLMAKPLR
jgi:ribosomal protein S18 acetylase RimI-like enzyme